MCYLLKFQNLFIPPLFLRDGSRSSFIHRLNFILAQRVFEGPSFPFPPENIELRELRSSISSRASWFKNLIFHTTMTFPYLFINRGFFPDGSLNLFCCLFFFPLLPSDSFDKVICHSIFSKHLHGPHPSPYIFDCHF